MPIPTLSLKTLRFPLMAAFVISLAACGAKPAPETEMHFVAPKAAVESIDPERKAHAIAVAHAMRNKGQRVWCVPFARNVSGIEIRGNAKTWWSQAKGVYDRGHEPRVGAVMAFSGTRSLPLGHVAVVSEIVSEREIKIDHANWKRNQISLGMSVVDISEKNDWSRVRVRSNGTALGRPYAISGFIYKG